jgi:hypothetical protein
MDMTVVRAGGLSKVPGDFVKLNRLIRHTDAERVKNEPGEAACVGVRLRAEQRRGFCECQYRSRDDESVRESQAHALLDSAFREAAVQGAR